MLEILNNGYVDVRVLIYDSKPVFYIRLYISLWIMFFLSSYCDLHKENQVSFQTRKTCM